MSHETVDSDQINEDINHLRKLLDECEDESIKIRLSKQLDLLEDAVVIYRLSHARD